MPVRERARLLIADGHSAVRADLQDVLGSQPAFGVPGEATTGAEAAVEPTG
jgi:DNA-binding NarL/FixJ family response regulator